MRYLPHFVRWTVFFITLNLKYIIVNFELNIDLMIALNISEHQKTYVMDNVHLEGAFEIFLLWIGLQKFECGINIL